MPGNGKTVLIVSKNRFIERDVALPLIHAGYTTVSVPYEKAGRLLGGAGEPSAIITGTEDPRVMTALQEKFSGTRICAYFTDNYAQRGETARRVLDTSKCFSVSYEYLAKNAVSVVDRMVNGS